MTEDVDIFGADLSGVEPDTAFAAAKAGVYDLTIPEDGVNAETYDGKNGKAIRVSLRYQFANPEGVEKVGDGPLGGIFHRLFIGSVKGAGFIRAMVEAHGGDWATFSEQLKQGAGLDINGRVGLVQEIFKQYIGTSAKAKVKYVTSYIDQAKNRVELDNPRNEISKYEKPSA